MIRKCEIFAQSDDGKRAVCIDLENKVAILDFVMQTDRYKKKWLHIVQLILEGHKNTELYDKEEVNHKCKDVTAMKFFKGQENDRIYCKEQKMPEGILIIVTAEIYPRKKSDKVSKREIPIIEKVASFKYKIE